MRRGTTAGTKSSVLSELGGNPPFPGSAGTSRPSNGGACRIQCEGAGKSEWGELYHLYTRLCCHGLNTTWRKRRVGHRRATEESGVRELLWLATVDAALSRISHSLEFHPCRISEVEGNFQGWQEVSDVRARQCCAPGSKEINSKTYQDVKACTKGAKGPS